MSGASEADALLPILRRGSWGFVDTRGRTVVAPRFENVGTFREGLAPAMLGPGTQGLGGRWGYVDREGAWVVEPAFDRAGPFREGRAAVNLGARPVYVPRDPVDVTLGGLSLPGSCVAVGGRWGYIDRAGWVVGPRFAAACAFGDGAAPVRARRRWGFVRRDGAWLVRPRYELAQPFSEGLAAVRGGLRRRTWQYIDPGGAVALRTPFARVGSFREGLAPVSDAALRPSYIDRTGEVVLRPPEGITAASSFAEGLAAVQRGEVRRLPDGRPHLVAGPWGFMSRDGEIAIEPRHGYARSFSEGRAPVRDERERWGFVDRTGRLAVACRWEAVGPFADGRAHVFASGASHYIDPEGDVLF